MKYLNNTPSILWDNKNPFETYIFKTGQKFADVLRSFGSWFWHKLYKSIDFAETTPNLKQGITYKENN